MEENDKMGGVLRTTAVTKETNIRVITDNNDHSDDIDTIKSVDGVIYHSRKMDTGFTGVQFSSNFVYESRKLIVAVDEGAGVYEILDYGK
jgi:hypothetical protein